MPPRIPTETPYGAALLELLQRLEVELSLNRPLPAIIAGGAAMAMYVSQRVSDDVDIEFVGTRVLIPKDLSVPYKGEDGESEAVHIDTNYNATFALMHENYVDDAVAVDVRTQYLQAKVLSPIDLAVSKIARLAPIDISDLRKLAGAGLITPEAVRSRALEAADYHVGDRQKLLSYIRIAEEEIRSAMPGASQASRPPDGCSL